MFKQIDYTMIIVSDMQRSVEFYRDKLGIPLKFQSPEWTEFATGTDDARASWRRCSQRSTADGRSVEDCGRVFDWFQR